MSQLLLFVLVYVVGVAVSLAVGPRHRPHVCGAAGFLVGLAVLVGLELVCLLVRIPFTRTTGLVLIAATLVGAALRLRGRAPEARAWRILGAWSVGTVVVMFALTRVNLSLLTYDSHYLVLVAGVIARDGGLMPGVTDWLGDYGVFQVLAHSLLLFTNKSFLWGLPPVLAASTIAVFAVTLGEALEVRHVAARHRRWMVALVTAATFSIYMLVRHSFYIQTNFGTAAYLLLFCVMFWMAEVTEDPGRLPLAFIGLAALAIHRIEAPLIGAVVLACAVLPSRLPWRAIAPGLVLASLVPAAWFGFLGARASPTSEFLTPTRSYLMAAVLPVFTTGAALAAWPRLRLGWLRRRAPVLLLGVTALALIGAFAWRYDHMATSAEGWFLCLLQAPYWAHAWLAIIVLAALGLVVPAAPARWVFVAGIPCQLALILLLVLNRTPYYFGMGDSAARMAVHVVPLAFFYFGIKFLPLIAGGAPASPTGDPPP